ncbi:MAG TPA: diacylglycerol kinase [Chitinophagaceae bacterium]
MNPAIKKIKDLSAGAVLLSAIISFIVGCIIFIPKIKMLLHSV